MRITWNNYIVGEKLGAEVIKKNFEIIYINYLKSEWKIGEN